MQTFCIFTFKIECFCDCYCILSDDLKWLYSITVIHITVIKGSKIVLLKHTKLHADETIFFYCIYYWFSL